MRNYHHHGAELYSELLADGKMPVVSCTQRASLRRGAEITGTGPGVVYGIDNSSGRVSRRNMKGA